MHPDCPVSHAFLRDAVRIAEQYPLLPEGLRDQLPLRHHRKLLTVASAESKCAAAKAALVRNQVISSGEFAAIVDAKVAEERCARQGRGGGRPRLPIGVKFVRKLDRLVKAELQAVDPDSMDARQRGLAAQALGEVIERLVEMRGELQTLVVDSERPQAGSGLGGPAVNLAALTENSELGTL